MDVSRRLFWMTLVFSLLTACDESAHSTRGFRLPEGNAEFGQTLFSSYGCLTCHTVDGIDDQDEKTIATPVHLGGPVTLNKTYADILTSIINPSHRIDGRLDKQVVQQDGQSVMANYNEQMTVAHLIDLVTFIETQYELIDVPLTRP